MNVGDVFLWDQYPHNTEGEHKARWFIYLGEFKESPDPFDDTVPVMIIAPTTTTQLHYYEPGESRAGHPHIRFTPKEGFGFTSECILDLAKADVVVRKTNFQKQEESGRIEGKGHLTTARLKEIYGKIYDSRGYSPKLKHQIRENLNNAGVAGLPELRRRRKNRRR
ncbi:MAG: hypothetical protein STSR0007_02830 [Thermovirga sp.]